MVFGFGKTGPLPIGVELHPCGARLLQLRLGRHGLSAIAAARIDLDDDYGEASEEERLEAIIEGVGKRVHGTGFVGRRCVLSLDDAMVRVRSVRQPKMPYDETNSAVLLEGADRLGFGEDEPAELGWIRAGEVRQGEDVREELLVVGASSERIEELVDQVTLTGLRTGAVEPGFLASSRVFCRTHRRENDRSVVRLVVNIEKRRTNVVVLRGADIVFYKSLTVGGDELDRLAAENLGLDRETIASLRTQRKAHTRRGDASAVDAKVDRAIFDALRPTLGELANELVLCVRYYSVTFRGARPANVVLIGSEACEPGLTQIVEEALSVPAVVGKPLDGIDISTAGGGFDRRGNLEEWSVACGLSLRAEQQAADASLRKRVRGGGAVASASAAADEVAA